jgi:hypothetical protein
VFVTDFAGRSTTRRPATSTTDFSFKNGVALDVSRSHAVAAACDFQSLWLQA